MPQDYAAAASWYRKAAEQGNAIAQFHLGFMYDFGRGVPQDYAAAVSWYRKAAEQGNADAQLHLGVMYDKGSFMYDKGKGVPQDDAAAVSWYRRAAEQGDAHGQLALGVMYFRGTGVPQDYVQAHSGSTSQPHATMRLKKRTARVLPKIATESPRRWSRRRRSQRRRSWREIGSPSRSGRGSHRFGRS